MMEVFNTITAQKMKFSMKGFFNKCDQVRRKLRIWLHLLKKYLMENFIFRAVHYVLEGKTSEKMLQKQYKYKPLKAKPENKS